MVTWPYYFSKHGTKINAKTVKTCKDKNRRQEVAVLNYHLEKFDI